MDTETRGTVLALAGVALLLVTLTASAAVAPDRGVTGGPGDARRTIVGIQGGGPGWHEYGSVALLEGHDVVWRESSAGSYFDVTMLDNGSMMAGFMDDGYQDCGPYQSPCSRTGFRVIDPDPQPHVVSEYSFPVRTAKNSEVHDVEALPGGGHLLTDMDRERIFVVEDGEMVWQWNASSFYEAPPDPTTTDWLHINDVDRIGEDQYLVSVRNANQLVVVERGKGVVEVVNADTDANDGSCTRRGQLADRNGDGDVRCGDPDVLNHQHNPQWLGGDPAGDGAAAVLVADSDNDRVVELHRTNGTWEVAWTLDAAGGIPMKWPRDADRLANGNTLVTDTLNKRVVEVTENGTVVWSVSTERIPYEADRLPEGERPTGSWYEGENPDQGDHVRVPVLDPATNLLRGVVPWLPFWYGGVQLGLTLVSLALVAAGVREYRR
ncbi:MAG: hypothetical protein ABEJ30_09600 [Halorientalis sp.]